MRLFGVLSILVAVFNYKGVGYCDPKNQAHLWKEKHPLAYRCSFWSVDSGSDIGRVGVEWL